MTLNTAKFTAIAETAKAKAAGNSRWVAAIDRAAAGILNGELIVTTLRDGALVTSPNGSYMANGACGCKAYRHGHRERRHRAAARLWELYESETAGVAVSSRADLIASIKSAWSAKFPAVNLADELMARFKRNSLEVLSIDFLQAIHAIL